MAVMLVCLAASLRAGEQWETLQAIHLIENPQNSPRPGAHGELGAYQFRQSTWRMHSRAPFRNALVRSHADRVAVAHYDWLVRELRRNGVRPTAYTIALAWNAGLTAAVSGRAPRSSHHYAQRVVNIADELRRATIASSIASRAPMKPIILTP